MAISRKTTVKKDVSVLESAKIVLDEEQGYKGDRIGFNIETIPESYSEEKYFLISDNDDIIKIDNEEKVLIITSDDLEDVNISLKDIPTEKIYDSVTVTASGKSPEDIKKLKQVTEKEEKKEEKLEKVPNPVSKTKTNKGGNKTMSEKVTVNRINKPKKNNKKEYNAKSYTKEEMINDLSMTLVDEDNNPAYSKRELNDIVSLVDKLRVSALKEGKTLTMDSVNFTRKYQKGRIHNPRLETVKKASFVTPHIVMSAKLESDDKEVFKGKQLDNSTFETLDGHEIDVDKTNEDFKKEFDAKFK